MFQLFHSKQSNSIRAIIFRSMSKTSILFITLLFFASSLIFFQNSFYHESQDALHQLDYISLQFQYYLDATENYSKTIISNQDVQNFGKNYNLKVASFQTTTSIKQQIRQIVQSTPFIQSVNLYGQKGEALLSTYPSAQAQTLTSLPKKMQWQVGLKNQPFNQPPIKTLSLIRPFYDITSGSLLGYVELVLPEFEIAKIYKNYTSSNQLFLIDENGRIQSSNQRSELNTIYQHFHKLVNLTGPDYFLAGNSLGFYIYFPTLNWYIVHQIPMINFLLPILSMLLLFFIIAILITLLSIYTSHHVTKKITQPLSYLTSHIQTIKQGNWVPIDEIACNDEVTFLLHSFNSMLAIQTKMKDDLIKAEKLKRQVSLNLLQQQVNPHFLYNTLDNICSLAELDEKDTLIQLVMNLSSFYRSSLSNGKMHVSIAQELEISKAYLKIMQIRYFNKFTYSITCPEELLPYRCIKLLLQPIIENSIYHGIKELPTSGHIQIEVMDLGDSIEFHISDNGYGIPKEQYAKIWQENSKHFGIKSIQQRIHLYYGKSYGLTISNSENGGCTAVITIPKEGGVSCQ